MAEATKKPTATKSKKPAIPKKITRTPKKSAGNPITNTINSAKKVVSSLSTRLVSIPRRYQYGVVIIVIVALLAAYFKSFLVAAIVNGQPIPRWTIVTQLEKEGGQKALDNLISKTLILQEARKQNVVVSASEIDEEISKIKESIAKTGEDYETAITAEGFTDQSLRENILLNKTLSKMVAKDIQVTEEGIQKYRDENKDSLPKDKSDEEVKTLVKDELTSTKRSEKIQELVARLKKDAKINYFVTY